MNYIFKRAVQGHVLRITLRDSNGVAITGLSNSTGDLQISTVLDNEPSVVAYSSAFGEVQTIASNGTWVAPASNHCRFAEVYNGTYEIQLAAARFIGIGTSAKELRVRVESPSTPVDGEIVVQLIGLDLETSADQLAYGGSNLLYTAGIQGVNSQTSFRTKDFDPVLTDDMLVGKAAAFYSQSWPLGPASVVRVVSLDATSDDGTLIVDRAPEFTVQPGDTVKIYDQVSLTDIQGAVADTIAAAELHFTDQSLSDIANRVIAHPDFVKVLQAARTR